MSIYIPYHSVCASSLLLPLSEFFYLCHNTVSNKCIKFECNDTNQHKIGHWLAHATQSCNMHMLCVCSFVTRLFACNTVTLPHLVRLLSLRCNSEWLTKQVFGLCTTLQLNTYICIYSMYLCKIIEWILSWPQQWQHENGLTQRHQLVNKFFHAK